MNRSAVLTQLPFGFCLLRISAARSDRQSWLFGHYADRLVVLRSETSFVGSGFGQRGEGRDVATLTIR